MNWLKFKPERAGGHGRPREGLGGTRRLIEGLGEAGTDLSATRTSMRASRTSRCIGSPPQRQRRQVDDLAALMRVLGVELGAELANRGLDLVADPLALSAITMASTSRKKLESFGVAADRGRAVHAAKATAPGGGGGDASRGIPRALALLAARSTGRLASKSKCLAQSNKTQSKRQL